MLYSLHEAQHLALVPLRYLAELARGWFGHPFSPLAHHPMSRRFAASSDLFLRQCRPLRQPRWNLDEARPEVVLKAVLPADPLPPGAPKRRKVLVVAPLSGHHATLLRDTVRRCSSTTKYGSATGSMRAWCRTQGPFHLDDYVDYVREWITASRRAT